MTDQCKIIQDLLPLYHDGVCSEASRHLVEDHLSHCEDCRGLLRQMDGELLSPAEAVDIDLLKGLHREIRSGQNRSFAVGIAAALAVIALSLTGVGAWWYHQEYAYYSAFVEGQGAALSAGTEGLRPKNSYVWRDDTYQYEVLLPGFLSFDDGFIGMSRLDNDSTQAVELAVTRWEREPYMFHVFVNGPEETRYFILDGDLDLHGNYSVEEWNSQHEELRACRETVREIIRDAIATWPFLDPAAS